MPSKVTRASRSNKPAKPRPDFPLTANGNGQWSKKIRGRVYYFGTWADPDAALNRYLEVKDDLQAGRKPRNRDGFTVKDLCNHFLTAKKSKLDNEEITPRTFHDYHRATDRVIEVLGKTRLVEDLGPDDFAELRNFLAKRLGPVALGNEINRIRIVFNFAFNNCHVDKPVRFGDVFARPSKRVLRLQRQKTGARMFEAEELRQILGEASKQIKAMILLGINCGFGNHDCSTLPMSALDLESGWVDFPRPKTGVGRRCPLWPETIDALRAVVKARPQPKDEADEELTFLTKYGRRWVRNEKSQTTEGKLVSVDGITQELNKILKSLDLKRHGISFYALRHTFETIGGESRDQVAVDAIMGHTRDDMASLYRERISDERLRDVVTHVRRWLFPHAFT